MRIHYDLTDAVVCVVDSIYDRMDETKEQIDEIIKVGCKKAPFLVIANNRDEPSASSKEVITEELGLTKITDRKWSKFDDYIVISHEMDSLLKLFFSNPNGIFTCYSMHPNRQSIKVINDNLHS